MRVIDREKIDTNCVFEQGVQTSWGSDEPCARLAYYIPDGKFSRSGSSEMCMPDAYTYISQVLKRGMFNAEQKLGLLKLLLK